MKEFDYKSERHFKKNRKWFERYLPALFSIVIFTLLGLFSLNISREVNNLTSNLDKFYNHPYKVRNAASEFNLDAFKVVVLWSGHSIDNIATSELGAKIKRKFEDLDSTYFVIKDNYLGASEDTKALWEAYTTFKNHINATEFNVNKINHDESDYEETNILLQGIVNKLEPVERHVTANADSYMRKSIIEKSSLFQKLNRLYMATAVFFVIGLFSAIYLIMNKNLNLYREQEKFIKAIEFSPVPIIIHKNGIIELLSKEWMKLTGYTKEEIPTIEEWSSKTYGEDYAASTEFLNKLNELDAPQEDGIWKVKTKLGGELIWKFRSGSLGDGYVFSSAIDVTEDYKKQQQIERLFKDKLKLATAVDQSPASIVMTDTKGNIEYVNNYFTKITGYSADEVSGKKPSILKSGYQKDEFYKELWETVSGGNAWTGEMKNKAKDGTKFWELASIYPIIDTHGNVTNYIAIKENITEKKLAEEALIKSEKKYRDLFDRSTDACLILKDGKYIDCNEAALKALGMQTKNELIGLKPSDISPEFQEDGARSDSEAIEKLMKAKKEKHLRFEWLHKNNKGEVIPSELMLTKIDEDEDYFYVVWRDITARKEFEKQLKRNLEEKEVLLAEVHHRVKNNLAIITGLLEMQVFTSENPKELVALSTSVQRIKSIAIIHEQIYKTGDFAAISIDESLQLQLENLVNTYSAENGKDIEVNYDLETVKINVNQAIPFGLLINELATNSLKYAFEGIEQPSLNISLRDKKDVIEFIIQSNGIEFTPSELKKSKDSLVQDLIHVFVSQLGGNLDILSSPNKGTSVTLTFQHSLKRGSSSNLVS